MQGIPTALTTPGSMVRRPRTHYATSMHHHVKFKTATPVKLSSETAWTEIVWKREKSARNLPSPTFKIRGSNNVSRCHSRRLALHFDESITWSRSVL